MENRAIVTPVPGTTRDTLEENVIIDGILFRLIDTAGLRESNDIVEIEGVNRTKSNLRRGDIVLFVVDASETDGGETEPAQLQELLPRQQLLVAYNKSDLLKGEKQDFRKIPRLRDDMVELLISARTGAGLKQLRNSLVAMVTGPKGISETGLFLTNKRHLDAVNRARESLLSAQKSRSSGGTSEFIAFDVREAAEALSEITGEVTSEEILNNIFGKFCIGK
jgi:tRNA modification GTPase